MHLDSKKGYTLPLKGAPVDNLDYVESGNIIKLHPKNFPGIKPKLLIKDGDRLIKSQPIYFDKNNPEIMFTAFKSGTVDKIVYGNKRSIDSIIIKVDNKISDEKEFNSYKLDKIKDLNKDLIKENLCSSGLWPTIRRRPFSKIAKLSNAPSSIFVTFTSTAPYSPSVKVIHDNISFEDLQAGCNVMKSLFEVDIHMFLPLKFESDMFNKVIDLKLHTFSGPHPSGNVGYHISHLDPIKNKDSQVWYISIQDLCAIGKLFLTGRVDWERIVAIGGHPSGSNNRHVKISKGTLVSDLLGIIDTSSYRLISGDILSGSAIDESSSVGFYDDIVSIVENKFKRQFMGWLNPGFSKYSLSRTFLSSLVPRKKIYNATTALNGSVRSIVPLGFIEKMCNLNILPSMLIKSIIAKDIEMMEELGIYECDSEDFGLCSFIDASKMDIVEIIQSGLDFAEAEG